jgi:hypothetical protein
MGYCPTSGRLSCIKDTFQSLLTISPASFPDLSTSTGLSFMSVFTPTYLAQSANNLVDYAVTAVTCALPIYNGSALKDPTFSLNRESSGACIMLPADPSKDYIVGVFNSSLAFPKDILGNSTLDNIRRNISSFFSTPFAICMAASPCDGLGGCFSLGHL